MRVCQEEGFNYGVRSFLSVSPFEKNGRFGAFAIYAPQNLEAIERALREEIARIVADGFSAEEVAAAHSGWLQQQTVSRSNDRELAMTLAARAYEGRDPRWDAALESHVGALTPEEIHAAVRRHLHPDRISVVHAGDFAKRAKGTGAKAGGNAGAAPAPAER